MKKFLLPLLALLFLTACEKESTSDLQPDQQFNENFTATDRGEKVNVCHNGHVINVSVNALAAHLAHGDTEGDCSTGCAPEELGEELEVTVNAPSGSYTLYVYPVDNSTGIRWSLTLSVTGATDIWDGDTNTDVIVQDQNAGMDYAAGLCASLKKDGCDWYLPARNELNAMYEKFGLDGTSGKDEMLGFYWGSTESNESAARFQNFYSGESTGVVKNQSFVRCRCVRR